MKLTATMMLMAGTALSGHIRPLRADDLLWPEVNRVALSYRVGFNISASVHNLGSPPVGSTPSLTGVSYADGFVGRDNSGNAGGLTSFWGYQSPNQVVDGNRHLLLRSSRPGAIGHHVEDPPCHGWELSYNREFARYGRLRLGMETAFNWMEFSASQVTAAADTVLIVDAFSLGYHPPQAPFTGTPDAGPFAPLLGTTPTRSPVLVSSELTASLYGLRAGPYVDWTLGKRFLATFSAGLSLVIVDGEYLDSLSFTTPAGTRLTTSTRASSVCPVMGGFAGLQGTLKLRERVNAFIGIQYQGNESYRLSAGGREAQIDFRKCLFSSIGMSIAF